MRFSVITPSFKSSEWLKLCIASVADQGVEVEHIIQDANSMDDTLAWLPQDPRVKACVEKDAGMYDAINRGLRQAKGEILSYLNCDEQYLPGALPAVQEFFEQHPEVDIVFANFIVVDEKGGYLFHRKVQTPQLYHTWVAHLATFTCATFFRRSLIVDHGLFFDPGFRIAGDAEWMVRVLKKGVRGAVLPRFTSLFTQTGNNLGTGAEASREAARLAETAPAWARALRAFIVLHHRLRRLSGGAYSQAPFSYALYTKASPEKRIVCQVRNPATRWRR